MRAVLLSLLLCGVAYAEEPAPPPATEPAPPPVEATPPVETPAPPPVETTPPPVETPPPPVEATTVTTTVVTPAPPPPPPPTVEKKRVDDYYSRQRGMGIFHNGHLSLSVWSGEAPVFDMGAATGVEATKTIASFTFEGAWLGAPSSFGNFHGIEFGMGLRTAPWDFFMQLGTGVTLFNIGTGQPGSLRLGGGFGFGFNFAHGYGYVRARAAMVIIPTKVDIEASWQWTPTAASTGYYDEQQQRLSGWYRPGKTKTAYEVYVERIRRIDTSDMREREFDGFGVGVGIAR